MPDSSRSASKSCADRKTGRWAICGRASAVSRCWESWDSAVGPAWYGSSNWDSWNRAAARARRRARTRRSRRSYWVSPGSTRVGIRKPAEYRVTWPAIDPESGSAVRRSASAVEGEEAPVAAVDSSGIWDGSIVRDCWLPSPLWNLSDEFTSLSDRVISDDSMSRPAVYPEKLRSFIIVASQKRPSLVLRVRL